MTFTLTVFVPESPSITVASVMVNVGSVDASLSLIVTTACPSAMVAPLAPVRFTSSVSALSTVLSPATVIEMVLVVSPAAKVRVPDLAV